LTDSFFEERQLWGVALESNFGKQLSETTFGGSCPEQVAITTLGSGFGEQLCGAGLGSHSGHNFGEQLSAAILGSSFREPTFWEPLWWSRFVEYV